jgi:dTDP-4-amino-4,6-dideoxygalactose transaminase
MKVPLLDLQGQHKALRPELLAAIERVMDSQQFVMGPELEALESEIARYSQAQFGIGCASGSDALLLALMSCGVGRGDEVITTPFSFFATASAITRLGARPVFVDIDERTYNISAPLVAAAITNRTKAIVPVHLYGQCAEMEPLIELGQDRGLLIIEDAAQAIGAEDRGRRAGSMGAIGCFSFYPSKNLGGAGDGGMLVTSDRNHAERLRMLRVHGAQRKYFHELVGINSRLDALQAVVLSAKLPHLDDWTTARQRHAHQYESMFNEAGVTNEIDLPFVRSGARHIFHQFVIRVRNHQRDALRAYLREHGIGAEVYYPVPLHLQKCFSSLGYSEGDFPASERAARETLALPVYPELTDDQRSFVVSTIRQFFLESKG